MNGLQANCSLYSFQNTPSDFVDNISFGYYYIKDSNGRSAVFTEEVTGYPNRFLGY